MAYGTKIALLLFKGLSEESPPKPEEQCQGAKLRNIEFQKQVDDAEEIHVVKDVFQNTTKQQQVDTDQKNNVKDVEQTDPSVEHVQHTAEQQQVDVAKKNPKNNVVKHVKQPDVSVEQVLLQHNAAASAERATNPKSSWKARNATFNQAKQQRIRTTTRNPGRRSC